MSKGKLRRHPPKGAPPIDGIVIPRLFIPAAEPLTRQVQVRLSPSQYAKLSIIAEENGLKVSDVLRTLVAKYIRGEFKR